MFNVIREVVCSIYYFFSLEMIVIFVGVFLVIIFVKY